MTCSIVLRSQGKSYPRTCSEHGLLGDCPPLIVPNPHLLEEAKEYLTVEDLISELQKYNPKARVHLDSTCCGCSGTVTEVKTERYDPYAVYIVG